MSPSTAMVSPFTFGRQLSTEQENQRMENPFVTDKDGNRKLQLQYDVHQFKPEEIQVKWVLLHSKGNNSEPFCGRRAQAELVSAHK